MADPTPSPEAALAASYDCIVVGSGPGGATVARDLTRSGARVLILERGQAAPVTGRARQALSELWFPGRSCFLAGSVLLLRGVTLGGSSMYFFGTAWPPPYKALDPYGLDLREDVQAIQDELRPAPLPRELMGPRAVKLMDSARASGFDWQPIPKFFDQAVMAGAPPHSPPPYEARWNARRFVEQAVSTGAVVVTGARVERVMVEQGTAKGVEVDVGGTHHAVRASRVVVSAGALGTPMILRASGIERTGRDYFYDPVTTVVGTVDGLDAGPEPSMVGAADLVDTDGYMLTDISRPAWLHRMLATLAGRPDRCFGYRSSLAVMVKVKDELSGAMTAKGRPGKPLTHGDRAKLRHGAEAARSILRHAGATRIYRLGSVAVHPGGTAKVGDVVNADLESEVRGLFVCDASVIPMAWGLPPTLTVLALGRRLARHLAAIPSDRRPHAEGL